MPPTPSSRGSRAGAASRAADGGTSYAQTAGTVFDSQPRVVSNLIVDQTADNPAAVAAAGDGAGCRSRARCSSRTSRPTWASPRRSTRCSRSSASSSTTASTWSPRAAARSSCRCSPTTRCHATASGSPDQLHGPDPGDQPARPRRRDRHRGRRQEAVNTTTAFVDQSQTYTSHPSHQVFLREYARRRRPATRSSTGELLDRPRRAAWPRGQAVKEQAADACSASSSTDQDVLNVPLLATDPYGRFVPRRQRLPADRHRRPAWSRATRPPTAARCPVPADAVRTGHAFLDDIAHHAVPLGDTTTPATARRALDAGHATRRTTDDGIPATYDDEMLDAHFVAGDGRINENIGLTAVHHVFHSEHNRLVGDIQTADQHHRGRRASVRRVAGPSAGVLERRAALPGRPLRHRDGVPAPGVRGVRPQGAADGQPLRRAPATTPASTRPSAAEFAHAVYRFGHSMLTETVARRQRRRREPGHPAARRLPQPAGVHRRADADPRRRRPATSSAA